MQSSENLGTHIQRGKQDVSKMKPIMESHAFQLSPVLDGMWMNHLV